MNTYMRSLFLERMEQEATEEEMAEAYRVVALNEGLVSESDTDTRRALAD